MTNVAGSLIKDARLQTGLTQRQLAERARTAQSTIAAYETGRKTPSLATLMRILWAADLELRMRLAPIDRGDEAVRRFEASWPSEVRERFRREQLEVIERARERATP
jgi:transcriptional regulator with XRE-family HTH domain